ncbi:DgyrCDS14336 [Dimorphilus gyrociliatus]|uniref:[histone H4]-N-methyl-L-lysine(20) N-methyltransferase n=1 Tax=Dimorphilus gyrociliatus TaxID=2664684 RepID=A0A7I8WDP3_9ANNE|nr:DgyrCDS14336 [Dimorphilus gyrociliatus]
MKKRRRKAPLYSTAKVANFAFTDDSSQTDDEDNMRIHHKTHMSLKDLCLNDDLATSMLIDPIIGFETRKMNVVDFDKSKLHVYIGIARFAKKTKAIDAVFDLIAETEIYFRKFYTVIDECVISFHRHLATYFSFFLTSSGFRLERCDRYKWENYKGAKVIATKKWCRGDRIKRLVGMAAKLSEKDEVDILIPGKNDHSVMYSTCDKRSQLWLGPISFINHDCNPNCKFVTKHDGTIEVVAINNIEREDEIFCNYGNDFFGKKNCFCECLTCEVLEKGFFAKENVSDRNEDEDMEAKYRERVDWYIQRREGWKSKRKLCESETEEDKDLLQPILRRLKRSSVSPKRTKYDLDFMNVYK